jgi:hexokinase
MLPSYQHSLPTGNERGDFLALDVGGSTFRIALMRLTGKTKSSHPSTTSTTPDTPCKADALQVRRIRTFPIDESIRRLLGEAFFDWIADRIGDMLHEYNHIHGTSNAHLSMGLAWSFPIDQTSPRSGRLLPMGKGFLATHGVEGQDLATLIMRSCRAKNVNVEMRAIVNDSAATLLAQAYRDPSTRMSLILGTGTNAAVYLPISSLHPSKFGDRPDSWFKNTTHVLVNTELSMLGGTSLPRTRWDDTLNTAHPLPNFQPLEYLVTGRYLAEIFRLVLLEAEESIPDFFPLPQTWRSTPYALDAAFLAVFEADNTPTLSRSRAALIPHYSPGQPTQITTKDLAFLRSLAQVVSHRAACYLGTALHALWVVRCESEGIVPGEDGSRVSVACAGSVVEKYPGYRERCQEVLDELSGGSWVGLGCAGESSVVGAAVAVGCLEGLED